DVRNIEKIMRAVLPISKHPDMPPEIFIDHAPQKDASFDGRKFRGRRKSRGYLSPDFRKRGHR
ncbi:MAG: hypothetical protein PHS88_12020, partial [Candidatus Omnitrophica bacterium]|nr:hypothetical protein [Candidatus Omnitrophota bacterium]